MSDTDLKVPPHSIEAERAVLGCMLLDARAIDAVTDMLKPEDFYREAHALVYAAAVDLYGRREPVDVLSVTQALRDAGKAERVGDLAGVAALLDAVASASNVRHYAGIVSDRSRLRRILGTAQEIAGRCYGDAGDVNEFSSAVAAEMTAACIHRESDAAVTVAEVVQDVFVAVESMSASGATTRGIATGFPDLDRIVGGFEPGNLVLVGARPSMGKTAFGLALSVHAAESSRKAVLFYSLEMTREDLTFRLLSADARLPHEPLRHGKVGRDEWPMLTLAASRITNLPIRIDHRQGLTAMDIRARSRRVAHEAGGLSLVVVDYLGLIATPGGGRRSDNREREVAAISSALKGLAKDLSVPVLALAQLNRECEKRPDKRPLMSDLRDSGALEQDADVVAFLYRDEVYNPNTEEPGIAEVIVRKNRHGSIGTAKLAWLPEYVRFESLARTDGPPKRGSNGAPTPTWHEAHERDER